MTIDAAASAGPRKCDWYFDIVSPFAYLQWKQRDRFRHCLELRPIPVVLGGLLNAWGLKGPAEVAPKRLQTYRMCQWRADRLGIPFQFPPVHPFSPVKALRLIVAAGATTEAVDVLFDAVFQHGLDVNDTLVLAQLGEALGLDSERYMTDPGVKQTLRVNGEHAVARGVFGVPTIDLEGELFWGEDATPMILDFLARPDLLAAPAMARLNGLPSGLG